MLFKSFSAFLLIGFFVLMQSNGSEGFKNSDVQYLNSSPNLQSIQKGNMLRRLAFATNQKNMKNYLKKPFYGPVELQLENKGIKLREKKALSILSRFFPYRSSGFVDEEKANGNVIVDENILAEAGGGANDGLGGVGLDYPLQSLISSESVEYPYFGRRKGLRLRWGK